jgi:hypothetical protein
MSKPPDAVTVVIPVHNAADRIDRVAGWRLALEKVGRPFEIIVVDDCSTDGTAERLAAKEPRTRVLQLKPRREGETRQGFGACVRAALADTHTPLFFYTALDYPYTPSDLRKLLERIDVRDAFMNRQPDLISGCRTGLATPFLPRAVGYGWKLFWKIFAGMPMHEPVPWHGWREFWYRSRVGWVYGVPMADVNSCFKLFRTSFLRRFPIQSDGDFVHAELVAKATFLTSIMDEVPLTPKPDPVPPIGDTSADSSTVFGDPQFTFPAPEPPAAAPTPATVPPASPNGEVAPPASPEPSSAPSP